MLDLDIATSLHGSIVGEDGLDAALYPTVEEVFTPVCLIIIVPRIFANVALEAQVVES